MNNPIDFLCLDINEVLARDIGLEKENIVNKKYTEIFSGQSIIDHDWGKAFVDVAIRGVSKEFEQYFEH
jgi:hypothetical protein